MAQPSVSVSPPLAQHPPAARDGAASSELSVSVAEVAGAFADGEVDRLLVVNAGCDNADRDPTVGLGRRLIAAGLACVLVDLSGGCRIADQTGLSPESKGMRHFGQGEATLSEVIHRDRQTRLHVVPSRGYNLAATEPSQADELGVLLSAFQRTYDCAVVVCDSNAVANLRPMIDRRTAVLLSSSDGGESDATSATASLLEFGVDDIIVMRDVT